MPTGEETYITECVREFGKHQGVPYLSEVVMDLYDASLRKSTRRTYKTGQRAYMRFLATMDHGVTLPFLATKLSLTELNLGFYIA